MCGISPSGLLAMGSIGLKLVASFSTHGSSNDGFVEQKSCEMGIRARSRDVNRFYRVKINHMDGTTRHMDGWWSQDRKPCKWFKCLL